MKYIEEFAFWNTLLQLCCCERIHEATVLVEQRFGLSSIDANELVEDFKSSVNVMN